MKKNQKVSFLHNFLTFFLSNVGLIVLIAFCNVKGQNENAGYLDEENSLSFGISVEEDCFDELDINSSSDVAGSSNMHIGTPFSLSMKDNTIQDVAESMIEDTPSSMRTSIGEEISASVDGDRENSFNSNTFMPAETSTNLVTVAKDSTTSLGHFKLVSSTSEETSLTNSYDHGYTCVEPCAKPSLEEKVAKFMQDGYLEPVEGNSHKYQVFSSCHCCHDLLSLNEA